MLRPTKAKGEFENILTFSFRALKSNFILLLRVSQHPLAWVIFPNSASKTHFEEEAKGNSEMAY